MAACSVLLLAACAYALGAWTRYAPASWRPGSATPTATATPAPASVPRDLSTRYIGVAPEGFPHSESDLQDFGRVTGVHPSLVSWYYGWGPPFDVSAARQIEAYGSLPFLNVDSDGVPVAAIADGRYDAYLGRYAAAVRAFGRPIAISFDHEANDGWYRWGYPQTKPAVFIAAWDRIHAIFARAGATNVIWVWMMGPALPGTAALKSLYPGDAYVSWVGFDCYYTTRSSTFRSVFGADLRQLRAFSNRPVLITETGVAPGSRRPAQIEDVFRGAARTPGIIGLVWFDYDKGPGHDWRIDNDPAAVTAFRRAAGGY